MSSGKKKKKRSNASAPNKKIEPGKNPVKQSEFPKSTGKKPEYPVSNGKKPGYPVSNGKKPELPKSTGKKPEYPVSNGKKPNYPVSNGKKPELPKSTGKKPEYPVSNGKKPNYPVSNGKKPGHPVNNDRKPAAPAVPVAADIPAKSPKSKKADHDREITLILSAILLVLTIAGIVLFFILPDPGATPVTPVEIAEEDTIPEETEDPEEIEDPEEAEVPEEPEEPEEPEISYPEPEYHFTEENVYVEIPGLEREYTIAWVSDVHMISDFEVGDVSSENLDTVLTRYETLSVTPDGIHAKDLWPEIITYLNYNDFDGVIFGGDILDYCSTSNMELLTEGMERLKYPEDRVLYLRADHDYGTWYSDFTTGFDDYKAHDLHVAIDGDDNTRKYLDYGEFVVAGVNYSIKNPGPDQMEVLTGLYNRGVPVIAATHVPYYSDVDDSLAELSMQVRGRIYYWSLASDHYVPNGDMWKYLDMIYLDGSPCVEVLAGHLHAQWDGEIRTGLRQHIFSPAFSGVIGVVHIIPAEENPD